ncbi:MAG: N-acetylmuramoyl-L-alanine amidase [Chthonomonas sp.]|nr:N-acetylmuramoyl-L-alanine amidase [Chthonomonas sp.]
MEAIIAGIVLALAQPSAYPLAEKEGLHPGRGGMIWYGSNNFGPRPAGVVVDTIVLHHTAGTTMMGVCKWFAMTESQASAHYTIGKDGAIVQHVSTFNRAWHAGKSIDHFGRENVNNFSVGFEMDNVGDGKDPWTDAQVDACVRLIRVLKTYRFKDIKYITSHEYVAEPRGRKNDPLNFPWDRLIDTAKKYGLELIYKLDEQPKKRQ